METVTRHRTSLAALLYQEEVVPFCSLTAMVFSIVELNWPTSFRRKAF